MEIKSGVGGNVLEDENKGIWREDLLTLNINRRKKIFIKQSIHQKQRAYPKQSINHKRSALKNNKTFPIKRLLLLLLTPLSMLFIGIVKRYDWIGEHIFARGIYIPLSKVISFITGIIPFSIMEVSIIVIPTVLLALFVWFIVKLVKKVRTKNQVWHFIRISALNVACVLSCVYFIYTVLCGVNYHRYSFSKIVGYTIEESTVEDLYALTMSLAEQAVSLREELTKIDGEIDENGLLIVNKTGWEDVAKIANDSYEKIASSITELGGGYDSLKTVHLSTVMSQMEITGIFWPFTMEANINIDAPQYTIPATMAHELAHQRGFMREDEANFIAYLVCKQSDNLEFRYSGIMLALSYAENQLYRQNEDLYRQVRAIYTDEMNQDVRDEYYYWAKYDDTVISTVSTTMNDNYLKANSQYDGVKSYGRMVDLLLAEYKESNQP